MDQQQAVVVEPRADTEPARGVYRSPLTAPLEPWSLVAAVGALADAAESWTGPARYGVIADLDVLIDSLTVQRARVLAVEEAAGTWRAGGGYRDFAAWRAGTGRTGTRVAIGQVRAATVLAEVPGAAEAVENGELTMAHVEAIGGLTRSGSVPARDAARRAMSTPDGARSLLAQAKGTDAGRFAKKAESWAARQDPDRLATDHHAQRARRFVRLSRSATGTRLSGVIDNLAAHRLEFAFEAVTGRPAEGDGRSREQRHADALEAIANAALADPATKPGAQVTPHVSLVVPVATWAAVRELQRARADARASGWDEADEPTGSDGLGEPDGVDVAGGRTEPGGSCDPGVPNGSGGSSEPGPGAVPWMRAVEHAVLEGGTPVSHQELARVLCDAQVTRVVMDAEGQVLDLGRTQRTYAGAHRRAVVARDAHCSWPGCDTRARWCEVHHITWWSKGGATSVDNGILLCLHHHQEVHRMELKIFRSQAIPPGSGAKVGYYFLGPDGKSFGERPLPPERGGIRARGRPSPRGGGGDDPPERPRSTVGRPGVGDQGKLFEELGDEGALTAPPLSV